MRIAILKAGTASRRTRERAGDYHALFQALLAQPGQQWECHDVEHGEFPASLAGCAGLVLTGSPAAAYEDTPWVHRLLDTIRAAHAAQVPLLGICFGMQAVAQALGGRVEPNPLGWELGVVELELTAAGRRWPPLAAAPRPLRLLQTHSDIVVEAPPGAVVLARSPRTRIELFTLGERVLCLQGHPELDADMVRELIDKREARGLLPPPRAAEGRASLALAPSGAFCQDWLRTFLREGRVPAAA